MIPSDPIVQTMFTVGSTSESMRTDGKTLYFAAGWAPSTAGGGMALAARAVQRSRVSTSLTISQVSLVHGKALICASSGMGDGLNTVEMGRASKEDCAASRNSSVAA